MDIKALIRNVTPPFLWKLRYSPNKKTVKKNQKTYSSFQAALRSCVTRSGYQDQEIVKVIFQKTKVFVDKLNNEAPIVTNSTDAFALIPFLRLKNSEELGVIDLGGACGAHYFLTKKIGSFSGVLKWYVVETKEMCSYGNLLENNELTFSDNFEETLTKIDHLDLLFTSGTLQCVEDPYDFLTRIVNSGAEYILFNRLGLTEGSIDVITTHSSMLSDNGIGPLPEGFINRQVEYPFNFIQKTKFDSIVKEKYDYKLIWDDPTGIFPVNDEPIIGMGLLCEKKK